MQLTLTQPPAVPSNWDARDLPTVTVPGLYVHVPFCFHKCHYCDFYSITRQTPERMSRFVDLILQEARGWTDAQRGPTLHPKTIFFGGGTPSLLPIDDMRRLLLALRGTFDLSHVDEWTVECNPATVSLEYCRMLRASGVTRLSFGAQSFDRAELASLERHHDPEDVPRSIDIARAAGFQRLSVDLIYAIPNQSLASWDNSLSRALDLRTEHLSCYGLTYESNTAIAVRKRLGQLTPATDDLELEMLHHTRRRLAAAGYASYEISNYARPGEECRHNLLYWHGGSYIGLGPSAASHVDGWRWRNRPHLGDWETALSAGGVPAVDVERLSPRQRAGERIMLELRLANGVPFAEFHQQTGIDARAEFSDLLERLAANHLIHLSDDRFTLTDRGLNVADAIAGEFLAAD